VACRGRRCGCSWAARASAGRTRSPLAAQRTWRWQVCSLHGLVLCLHTTAKIAHLRSVRNMQQWTMLAQRIMTLHVQRLAEPWNVLPNMLTKILNIDAVTPHRRSNRRRRVAVPAGALCRRRGGDRPPARAAAETQPAAQDRLRRGGPAARAAAGVHQVLKPCTCTAVSCARPKACCPHKTLKLHCCCAAVALLQRLQPRVSAAVQRLLSNCCLVRMQASAVYQSTSLPLPQATIYFRPLSPAA
jgi:hypothetical protein